MSDFIDEVEDKQVVLKPEKEHVKTPREVWNERYASVRTLKPKARFLTAFNANVDAVVFVDHAHFESVVSTLTADELSHVEKRIADGKTGEIRDHADFIGLLLHCMNEGKGMNYRADRAVFEWFEKTFHPRERRMGGQAGIVANQLAELGLKVTSYCGLLSAEQAKYFDKRICFPVAKGKSIACTSAKNAARKGDATKTNWIFEFHRGQSIKVGHRVVTAPRANRLIVSMSLHYHPVFPKEIEKHLPKLAQMNEVAFLAGYQSVAHAPAGEKPEKILKQAAGQIKLLKRNKKLTTHVEYVEPGDEKNRKFFLKTVVAEADSIGLNEVELLETLKALDCDKEAKAIEKHENSYTVYLGCEKVMAKLNMKRVHLHNFGFHILLLKKPFEYPEKARDALVYSALAACVKAKEGTRYVTLAEMKKASFQISETGVNQLNAFEGGVDEARKKRHSSFDRKRLLREGVFDLGDHFAIIIPTPIVQNPQSTVGLGDTVSSTALAIEKS